MTFTVPIEKEVTRTDKNGEEITKNISYISQFVDSTRLMVSSLSNLVNNPSEEIHRFKCSFGHDDKTVKLVELKMRITTEYANFKNDLIEYKCLCCNKNYQHKFDAKLKEQFFKVYKFFNHNNNKFILLLQKGVYPYKYMGDWEKFNETSLPVKEDFYSHLNMEDIADADDVHAKRVCKDFEIKNLQKYHDLYDQRDHVLMYLRISKYVSENI